MIENQQNVPLNGTIKHIVYQNQENGYTVLKTIDEKTLCGILPETGINLKDAEFNAIGSWRRHKKYGPQFHFQELTINESDLFYFLSRIVKGIGKKLAHHLLTLYDEQSLVSILEDRPEELLKVKGIKEKKLARIRDSWEKFKHLRELSETLIPYGATHSLVVRIYRHYSEDIDINEKIRENPYLITEVKGIGFKTADRLALAMGIDPASLYRIKSCIQYVMQNYTSEEGNSCVSDVRLFELVGEALSRTDDDEKQRTISVDAFHQAVDDLVSDDHLIRIKEESGAQTWLTSSFLYGAETYLLETAARKNQVREPIITKDIDTFVQAEERELGVLFSEEQKQAIYTINDGVTFFILAGYAGTGKSTVCKALLDLLFLRYGKDRLMCCALSGIASDRIRKLSGYNASTIQSLLVKSQKEEQLNFRVLLVDEASMVNSELFYRLFRSLKNDCIIILVGDPAQLPPIGAGDPFHDLIQAEISPIVTLKKIFRQTEDHVLTTFANHIRKATVPREFRRDYTDFRFHNISIENYFARIKKITQKEKKGLREENSRQILERLCSIAEGYKQELQNLFSARRLSDFISHFQLITPIKGGMLGADHLNELLQGIFNPQQDDRKLLDLGMIRLHLYDRVVHINNHDMDCYDPARFRTSYSSAPSWKQRIYNGMIGLLFRLDRNEELLWVYYPSDKLVVEYAFDEARDLLRLSYALTIHKTQGSEFQNVLIPMSFSHFIMLNNKLLYTAVTRAKKTCILVGEHYAFTSACRRKDVTIRDTVMRLKLNSLKGE